MGSSGAHSLITSIISGNVFLLQLKLCLADCTALLIGGCPLTLLAISQISVIDSSRAKELCAMLLVLHPPIKLPTLLVTMSSPAMSPVLVKRALRVTVMSRIGRTWMMSLIWAGQLCSRGALKDSWEERGQMLMENGSSGVTRAQRTLEGSGWSLCRGPSEFESIDWYIYLYPGTLEDTPKKALEYSFLRLQSTITVQLECFLIFFYIMPPSSFPTLVHYYIAYDAITIQYKQIK